MNSLVATNFSIPLRAKRHDIKKTIVKIVYSQV